MKSLGAKGGFTNESGRTIILYWCRYQRTIGIVDASECPPTFGVPFDLVIGLIAGGDTAIRKAVEFAEDDTEQAWKDLSNINIRQ